MELLIRSRVPWHPRFMAADVVQEVMTLLASSRSAAITDARAYALGITTRVCARLSRDLRRRREALDALGRTLPSATRMEEAPCEREREREREREYLIALLREVRPFCRPAQLRLIDAVLTETSSAEGIAGIRPDNLDRTIRSLARLIRRHM
jgi:DNA-directed RNA polymerase specialized sigma24 family protein